MTFIKMGGGLAGFILCLVLYGLYLKWDPLFKKPYSRVLLDKKGELLTASLARDEQWRFPLIDEVPVKFAKAIIHFEDKRFFSHPGVDIFALFRALWLNFQHDRVVSGASTISMQVIRLARGNKARTVMEKMIEMVSALALEISHTKKEILKLYSSHAPFGGNVVGLDAAAWRYFGRPAHSLSWSESAMLAVLPNDPSLIHLGRNRARLLHKRNRLLKQLKFKKIITEIDCELASLEALPKQPKTIPNWAPHYLQRLKPSSHKIRSTINKQFQELTVRVLKRNGSHWRGLGVHNAAAIILSTESKDILAYVGNTQPLQLKKHSAFVDIIPSLRSTGSLLKPFLYTSMVKSGELMPHQLVADIPTRIAGFAPRNYNRTYDGAVPASQALARSLNIPAVRLLHQYTVPRFYDLLLNLGMTTLTRSSVDYGLSLILGGAESSLLDLTGLYADLGACARGLRIKFFQAAECWITMETLTEVRRPENERSWKVFKSARKIAWKTGTSYGLRDAWAIGVSPEYTVGVWVGNADGEGRPGLTGVGVAAPVLFDIFSSLPVTSWFQMPGMGLKEIEVCAHSGHRAGPHCKKVKKQKIPVTSLKGPPCPYCVSVPISKKSKKRVHSSCSPVSDISPTHWFVLPPAMEWYYQKSHSQYKKLPPYQLSCLAKTGENSNPSMSILYPNAHSQIYIPRELGGERGKVVLQAVHRKSRSKIYWHLDDKFIGTTRHIHQLEVVPELGDHLLTLVDELGETRSQRFKVVK